MSTQNKHTPGPWHIETLNGRWPVVREVKNPGGEAPSFISTISCEMGYPWGRIMARVDFGYGYNSITMEANTRLIAAAPDLLAACEEAERAFGDKQDWEAYEPVRKLLLLITAALKKARGEA